MFGYFSFNQSKNNVVLELKTGHFQRLGFEEAKVKDLSLEAEDLKMCFRGQQQTSL